MQSVVQRPNVYYSKRWQKRNWKKEYTVSFGTAKKKKEKKIQPPRQLTQVSGHSIQLNCIKTKLIFIKSHQCFPEESHALLIEVNSEFLSKSSLF